MQPAGASSVGLQRQDFTLWALWYDFDCGLAYVVVRFVAACLLLCSPGTFSKTYIVHSFFCRNWAGKGSVA